MPKVTPFGLMSSSSFNFVVRLNHKAQVVVVMVCKAISIITDGTLIFYVNKFNINYTIHKFMILEYLIATRTTCR